MAYSMVGTRIPLLGYSASRRRILCAIAVRTAEGPNLRLRGSPICCLRTPFPFATADGMPFDTSGIELVDWGSLTMHFDDDESGQVSYSSHFEGFGSGSYPIQRLARPLLADCQ